MIDELISRVKDMYHQLERDEARFQRMQVENLKFGVAPDEAEVVDPVPETTSPSGSPPGTPPPVSPEAPLSLLDLIGRARGGL